MVSLELINTVEKKNQAEVNKVWMAWGECEVEMG